uniref:Uncharacterized protein n=1 Tax=Anguilla anguilla TaxID=7936 RepID=A0A0E9RI93_ANGAN
MSAGWKQTGVCSLCRIINYNLKKNWSSYRTSQYGKKQNKFF